ncbi:D-tyrosyl-tRNA(Tyr) deacylase [Grifola frondosa]|uniref:D-aminoacyl-tRNA deacylase n=1 Tax=Grifola frondosa TaxID=5627 RepID=A0A1C7LLR5_GRIFR|nr:D-tyrosyl-tRNA(Tyr) deacylase [Grifola frondosa]
MLRALPHSRTRARIDQPSSAPFDTISVGDSDISPAAPSSFSSSLRSPNVVFASYAMRAVVQRVSSASVTGSYSFFLLAGMCMLSISAVDNEVVSSMSRGLMVLSIHRRNLSAEPLRRTDDTATDVETLSKKMYVQHANALCRASLPSTALTLRVFSDTAGAMWKKSVKDIEGDVLCVSQFTLLANTSKGNKPDFHRAMATGPSRDLYSSFLDRLCHLYRPEKIKDGRFGAMMDVRLTNEGPVTFTLDSRKFEYVDQPLAAGGEVAMTQKNAKAAQRGQEAAGENQGVQ